MLQIISAATVPGSPAALPENNDCLPRLTRIPPDLPLRTGMVGTAGGVRKYFPDPSRGATNPSPNSPDDTGRNTMTDRVTCRIDRALWDTYWSTAADAGHNPAALLAAFLTAWANASPLPRRPDTPPPLIDWGTARNATITTGSDWWADLHVIAAASGHTRADVIDRACRWWLGLDTLPPVPPPLAITDKR
jgi:hypothetical protein